MAADDDDEEVGEDVDSDAEEMLDKPITLLLPPFDLIFNDRADSRRLDSRVDSASFI